MKEGEQIKLRESKYIKYVIVEMDLKAPRTRILSGLSIWGNIRVFASAIGMSYSKLISEGGNPKIIYKQLESIIVEMLQTEYTFEPTKIERNKTNGEAKIKPASKREASVAKKKVNKSRKRSVKTKRTIDSKQPIERNDKQKKQKQSKAGGTSQKGKKRN